MIYTDEDLDRIKSRYDLSSIVSRHVKLRKAGRELVGLCPFHEERTPSFRINDAKGVYHCFGCDASGDIIDFVRAAERLSFIEAVRWLDNGDTRPTVSPERRRAHVAAERAERSAAILAAQAQWHGTRSIKNTPAERYLHSRGIVDSMPASIRFGRVPLWRDPRTGADGRSFPALVAACQNKAGEIVGVQRVFLTEEGCKAPIANPKLSLGQVRGCTVRLGPVAREIILCEGPEDGLTLRQNRPDASIWVSLGTGALPYVDMPDEAESITLAGDNNDPGRAAVAAATETFNAQGRSVRSIYPNPAFNDWNDELTGRRA